MHFNVWNLSQDLEKAMDIHYWLSSIDLNGMQHSYKDM